MPHHCHCNHVFLLPHCHHCRSSHTIAAVAVPLHHRHTIAVTILFATELPCHRCGCHIAASSLPSLLPLLQSPYHHCHHCVIIATVAMPSLHCHVTATAIALSWPSPCHHCHHCSQLVAIALPSPNLPCHPCSRQAINSSFLLSLSCH